MRADIEIAGVETGEHLDAKADSLSRTMKELDRIDRMHSGKPTCGLCGQRVNRLDPFGLCSRITPSHERYRPRGDA